MHLNLTVYAKDDQRVKAWTEFLRDLLQGLLEGRVDAATLGCEPGQVVLLDASMPGLDAVLNKMDRRGRALFLVVENPDIVPNLLVEERVDDVLVVPFRRLEVLSKLRYTEQILMWNEVGEINLSISEVLKGLRDDLGLVERLQKARIPKRFPQVKGFQVSSRYLAGMRPGGDYFDLAESSDGARLSLLLSDSSSYGLSSAVLAALMRVTLKLSSDQLSEEGAVLKTVRRIYDELLLTLKENDLLSLFYGTFSREDRCFRFLNLGQTIAFHARFGHSFQVLPGQGAPICRASGFSVLAEGQIKLLPEDRLVIISNGFIEAVGGVQSMTEIVNQFREKESADLLNELTFHVKQKLTHEDDMPARDCTVLVINAGSRVLKLASGLTR